MPQEETNPFNNNQSDHFLAPYYILCSTWFIEIYLRFHYKTRKTVQIFTKAAVDWFKHHWL